MHKKEPVRIDSDNQSDRKWSFTCDPEKAVTNNAEREKITANQAGHESRQIRDLPKRKRGAMKEGRLSLHLL